MILKRLTLLGLAAAGLALIGMSPNVARAQVKPGDEISAANSAKVKELLSPGVYWMVTKDMRMKIVPTERVDWPPPYKEATEQYASQVRLSADHRSVIGYV